MSTMKSGTTSENALPQRDSSGLGTTAMPWDGCWSPDHHCERHCSMRLRPRSGKTAGTLPHSCLRTRRSLGTITVSWPSSSTIPPRSNTVSMGQDRGERLNRPHMNPQSDLYWAIRVGFADAHSEKTEERSVSWVGMVDSLEEAQSHIVQHGSARASYGAEY